MESFLETNSNENSFYFLTLSNKFYKKCPAMEHCTTSLDCFNYYAECVAYLSTYYEVISSIEKYHDAESYHLHIMINPILKPVEECVHNPGLCIDFTSLAELHLEKYQSAEWIISTDKYDNAVINHSPSFKLKIVNTLENKKAVKSYIYKYLTDGSNTRSKIKDYLLTLLITKYIKSNDPKTLKRNKQDPDLFPKNYKQFMRMCYYSNQHWVDHRIRWQHNYFKYCYVNDIKTLMDFE